MDGAIFFNFCGYAYFFTIYFELMFDIYVFDTYAISIDLY